MTDAHCHAVAGESRHFLCAAEAGDLVRLEGAAPTDLVFAGVHPWHAETLDSVRLREALVAHPRWGVGEIGLDRLKTRDIAETMRRAFLIQLALAAELRRPVALHGAKCWGEVVRACETFAGLVPAFVFHGFSRSDGLLPDIWQLGGYVSVGPAILNDHAVNYRAMAKKIPIDRLLVESDRTAETAAETPSVADVAAKLAEIRGVGVGELIAALERNADRILEF